MRPNLRPGDEVVAVDDRAPRVGEIVVFPHPIRDDFWMIKRVAHPPQPLPEDRVWVLSDNPGVTEADSRTLGPLPVESMWTVVERLDSASFAAACDLLAGEDEALARILDRHGIPQFWERRSGFATLVWLILEQQVSLESGAAMYRRLHQALGAVTPETVIGAGSEDLRRMGVTRQKAEYLVGLADEVLGGQISLGELETLPVPRAREALLGVRGIGPWTADAYLLSALRHPDVFPVGDRALQVGVAETLGMGSIPDPAELEILSEPWRPIRAAAARIIWHGYLGDRGRIEPTDPGLAQTSRRDA